MKTFLQFISEATLIHSGSIGSNINNFDDFGDTNHNHWDKYKHAMKIVKTHALKDIKMKFRPYGRISSNKLDVDGHKITHKYEDNLDDYNRGKYNHVFSGSKEALSYLKQKYNLPGEISSKKI